MSIKIEKGRFKPNDLLPEDVDQLEDWQLLVATCHWGSTMGDCLTCEEGGYGYELKAASVFDDTPTIWMGNISLGGDIDLSGPETALRRYGEMPHWKDWARDQLKMRLTEEKL